MTQGGPQFPDPLGLREPLRPGARAHKAGLTIEQRLAALEQGALGRPGPGVVDGSVVTSDTTQQGGVGWVEKAIGSIYKTANQDFANNSWTKMTSMASNIALPSGIVDAANSRLVIPEAGYYRVTLKVYWFATGTTLMAGGRIVRRNSANTVIGYPAEAMVLSSGGWVNGPVVYESRIAELAAGDRLELEAYWQYGGGATTHRVLGGGVQVTYLEAERVR